MNHDLHRKFGGTWERRNYSPPKSGLDCDKESYVVEIRDGLRLPRIVEPSVTPANADKLVAAHEKWIKAN